jgi:hypothetical protein
LQRPIVRNVVEFHQKASRMRASAAGRAPEGSGADLPKLVERFNGLHSKARTQLRDVILLLDLAAQKTRRLARRFDDPALKKLIEEELLVVENLLQAARDKMLQL